jgi:hypothetical protein
MHSALDASGVGLTLKVRGDFPDLTGRAPIGQWAAE